MSSWTDPTLVKEGTSIAGGEDGRGAADVGLTDDAGTVFV